MIFLGLLGSHQCGYHGKVKQETMAIAGAVNWLECQDKRGLS
jgi:hypothetical protein